MKDVRVDSEGALRCWNCGNTGLLAKRTLRSKMLVGVGALLTKKKLKCQTCDEYNDTGNAKPFTGPEARKWRKAWEQVQAKKPSAQRAAEDRAAVLAVQALASEVAKARASGVPFDHEEEDIPALPPPPPPPTIQAPSITDLLGKLAALRDSGALSDEEFAAAKALLLS